MNQRTVLVLKRLVVSVGVIAALVTPTVGLSTQSPVFTSIAQAAKKSSTVYITRTGHRYHRRSCRYLKRSKIKTNVVKAKRLGNTRCKVCKPPKK